MSYNSKYTGAEVEALLDKVDTLEGGGSAPDLSGYVTDTELTEALGGKQDTIDDLETIRSGAAKGATALQSVPSGYVTETKLTESLGSKVDKVEGKQLSTEDFTSALKTKLEGLNNYDDTTISEAVESLRSDFDKLVSGDTTTAIASFNEIVAFLEGIEDSESLDGIIASIEQQIVAKQNKLVSGTNIKTINGTSILGSGNIVIEGGSSDNSVGYLISFMKSSDTTATISPNTLYWWDEMSSLNISFDETPSDYTQEYLFQFKSGATATTLTLPDTIQWVNGTPTIEANKTYQVSIVNNIGLIVSV